MGPKRFVVTCFFFLLQNVLFNGNYLLLSYGGGVDMAKWININGMNRPFSTSHKLLRWIQYRRLNVQKVHEKNAMASKKLTHWFIPDGEREKASKFNSFLVENHICCCLRSFEPCALPLIYPEWVRTPLEFVYMQNKRTLLQLKQSSREREKMNVRYGKTGERLNTGKECLFVWKRNKNAPFHV